MCCRPQGRALPAALDESLNYSEYMGRPQRFLAPCLSILLLGQLQAAKTLDIYFIDVEGGQSTLVVSPSGQSLLIDAGSTGFSGRDSDRIAAAAKAAGVKRIDFLLITTFQKDHVGGVANLLERLPVTTFLDAGEGAGPEGKYPDAYASAVTKGTHNVLAAAENIPLKGLDITVVAAAGKYADRKGDPNQYCADLEPPPGDPGGDPQSVGMVVEFGKFRFGDFSDLPWKQEVELLCPGNRAGKLDVYLTTRHGGKSPKAIWALAPRVAILNNGPSKGGEAAGWKMVTGSPGLEDLWQLHFAIAGGKETNVPDSLIANVDESCTGQYLKISASPDGAFTVLNSRNKYSKAYPAK